MYRFLARPRWIGFALLVLAMIAACLFLSRWQFHRLHQREAYNAVVHHNIDQTPMSPDDLLAVGRPLRKALLWRSVAMTGRYDTAHVLLARKRVTNGEPGFWVLTPFRGQNGTALWVNRGWVAPGDTARSEPIVPEPPAGTITIVARMRLNEDARQFAPADLPKGQIDRIDVPGMSAALSYPTYGGYGELVSERPSGVDAPTLIPPPETDDGPHLSYAIQWITFAIVAAVGWYVLIRKEYERLAEERADTQAGEGPDPGVSGTPEGQNDHSEDDARLPVEGNA